MEGRGHGPPRVVGRYAMYDAIAAGGMATVHFGRLLGPAGFSRTVVIKRLHAQFAGDAEVAPCSSTRPGSPRGSATPTSSPVIDVVAEGERGPPGHGVRARRVARVPHAGATPAASPARLRLLGNVVAGALHGLHAAHEATGENGRPLGVVHRDVSPQNILVGVDGVARVLDFGIAKAAGQMHSTSPGLVKGKIRYMSPEQVTCGDVDRRSDLWAAAVVLWEALTGARLFPATTRPASSGRCSRSPSPRPPTSRRTCPRPSPGW